MLKLRALLHLAVLSSGLGGALALGLADLGGLEDGLGDLGHGGSLGGSGLSGNLGGLPAGSGVSKGSSADSTRVSEDILARVRTRTGGEPLGISGVNCAWAVQTTCRPSARSEGDSAHRERDERKQRAVQGCAETRACVPT